MAYNHFTISQITKQFAVQVQEQTNLFPPLTTVTPSDTLNKLLSHYIPLAEAIGTEKAKSEFIIAPILAELRELTQRRISLFSGIEFNVDVSRGLNGRCDYIVSNSSMQYSLCAPILMLVEAKNDNINSGMGQCMAEMIAAQIFNQREGSPDTAIYGCITTGSIWRFLKLTNTTLIISTTQYFIGALPELLAILLYIVFDINTIESVIGNSEHG